MRVVLAFLIAFLALTPVAAASETPTLGAPINRASPRDTYQSFLTATKLLETLYSDYAADKTTAKVQQLRQEQRQIRQLMDLSAVPPSIRVKVGNAASGYLSDILARLPPLDPASIPGGDTHRSDPGAIDDGKPPAIWTIPGTDIKIRHIDDGPYSGSYLFSAESIAQLPELYRFLEAAPVLNPELPGNFHQIQINATGPLISEAFVNALPEVLKAHYFDTPAWKVLAALVIMAAVVAASVGWLCVAYRRSGEDRPLRRLSWRMTVPLVILALLWAGEWFVAQQINPAGLFAASELVVITMIRFVAGAWLAWLALQFIADAIIQSPRIPADSYDANLVRLTLQIIGFAAVGTILALGADEIGIPALGLVAGFGVGGFAVALAARSTLENLLSGVSLFLDRPFRIGDRVSVGDMTATVVRIGPRSSRLRPRDGTLCTVPNSDLAKATIVNFTARDGCLLDQTLDLRGDSTPDRVQTLLQQSRALFDQTDLIEKTDGWPRLHLVGTAPGRVTLRFQARVLTTEEHVFFAVQEHMLMAVLSAMSALDLELAAPLPAAAPAG